MNWNYLINEYQLIDSNNESEQKKIFIFKHSTRCSISSAALARIERNWNDEEMKNCKPYYLDVIANRNISNAIANLYHIEHESPQALIIENGKCIYHQSHTGIIYDELKIISDH